MSFPDKPGKRRRLLEDEVEGLQPIVGNGLTNEVKSGISSKVKKQKKPFDFSIHPKRKIALKFLYHGWLFDGLVMQANTENTIERYLRDALIKTRLIESWETCEFSRCGRTDKGVSAFQQVAAVVVRSSDPQGDSVFWKENTPESVTSSYKGKEELNYLRMINATLPSGISVTGWAPVPRDFSARHGCNMRVYRYSLPRASLDIEKITEAAAMLIGEHDFRNFCQIDMNESRLRMNYVRRIFDVSVTLVPRSSKLGPVCDLLELVVKGSGFLWHQIRYIVTILHDVGMGNELPSIVSDLLDIERNPRRPHYTLAADSPLCLFECRFDSANLQWQEDAYTMGKTMKSLQSVYCNLQVKSRMLENMLSSLTLNSTCGSEIDFDRGLNEFTQDRALAKTHVAYADRPKCDSLEEKLRKMRRKQGILDDGMMVDNDGKATHTGNDMILPLTVFGKSTPRFQDECFCFPVNHGFVKALPDSLTQLPELQNTATGMVLYDQDDTSEMIVVTNTPPSYEIDDNPPSIITDVQKDMIVSSLKSYETNATAPVVPRRRGRMPKVLTIADRERRLESMREYQKRRLATETTEQRNIRLANLRRLQKERIENETAEMREKRLQVAREYQQQRRRLRGTRERRKVVEATENESNLYDDCKN